MRDKTETGGTEEREGGEDPSGEPCLCPLSPCCSSVSGSEQSTVSGCRPLLLVGLKCLQTWLWAPLDALRAFWKYWLLHWGQVLSPVCLGWVVIPVFRQPTH